MTVDVRRPAAREGSDAQGRFVFVLEQTLGNRVHGENVARAAEADPRVDPHVVRVDHEDFPLAGLPLQLNWTVESSWMARRAVRRRLDVSAVDALYVHSQTPAQLLGRVMRRVPTVISTDATPANFDEVGDSYGHRLHPQAVESCKRRVTGRAYRAAAAVVTWSRWTWRSVVEDYGVPPDRLHMIPPGVDLTRFRPSPGPRREGPPRLLFVGGDFRRKGGDDLLQAVRQLPEPVQLDIVTSAPVADLPVGVRVHTGLTHGDPALSQLYGEADVFCLPTHGDCQPHVLAEALACGLPVVATDVGAVSEVVTQDCGLLVPPRSPERLRAVLAELVAQPQRRAAMSARAREEAERRHDARRNAAQLLDLMRLVAAQQRHRAPALVPGTRGAA